MLLDFINFLSHHGDPEQFHEYIMKYVPSTYTKQKIKNIPPLSHHLKWNNRIGLAAGFDKNGEYLNKLSQMGFGAIEVGTITPRPQQGNPRPRIKKITSKQSILNWMGFPSAGMDEVYNNLIQYSGNSPLGINIGKNKLTPNSKAINDYLAVALKLKEFAHYFVINISSPNTPGLRDLQDSSFIKELLEEFKKNNIFNIFIKIAPDLSKEQIIEFSKLPTTHTLSGFIATNTTNQHSFGKGGLSGFKLKEKTFQTIELLKKNIEDAPIDIVACGGINSMDDIIRYQNIGISLFQIYSSFVYQGPKILKILN